MSEQSVTVPAVLLDPNNLRVSPVNPRPAPTADQLAELRASIQEHGILQPLLARPVGDGYDVVAGQRRLLCARELKLDRVPCVVREMSDDEARELAIIENLQREELDVFAEAVAIGGLLERHSAAEVSRRLGKTAAFLTRRANLSKLSARWQKAIRGRGHAAEYSPQHLELVALMPAEMQDGFLRESWRVEQGLDIRRLRETVAGSHRRVSAAPFDVADESLVPKAGACGPCLKNTANETDLFEGVVKKSGGKSTPTCTDAACWRAKLTAHRDSKVAAARAKHPGLVLVDAGGYRSGKPGFDSPEDLPIPRGEKVVKSSDLQPCKRGAKGAVPVLVVRGRGAGGAVRFMRPNRYASSETKAAASSAASKGSKKKLADLTPAEARKQLKEKSAALRSRRHQWVIDHVCQELREILQELQQREVDRLGRKKSGSARARPRRHKAKPASGTDSARRKGDLVPKQLLELVAAYGCSELSRAAAGDDRREAFGFESDRVREVVFAGVLEQALPHLAKGDAHWRSSQYAEATWLISIVWGSSPKSLDEAAALDIPEPKSWASLKAIVAGKKKATAKKTAAKKTAAKKTAAKKTAAKKTAAKKTAAKKTAAKKTKTRHRRKSPTTK